VESMLLYSCTRPPNWSPCRGRYRYRASTRCTRNEMHTYIHAFVYPLHLRVRARVRA
jgi:hypothetical protein